MMPDSNNIALAGYLVFGARQVSLVRLSPRLAWKTWRMESARKEF